MFRYPYVIAADGPDIIDKDRDDIGSLMRALSI